MTNKAIKTRSHVSDSIGRSLGASVSLNNLVAGNINPSEYTPENTGQYWQFRRYMHDVFCYSLIDSGYYSNHEFTLQEVGIILDSNSKVNRQKPDLYSLSLNSINLADVSASYNPEQSYRDKVTKYKDLTDILISHGYEVTFSPIIIDLTSPEWIESFPKINDLYIEIINDMLHSLRLIHNIPKFQVLRKEETGMYNTSRFQFKLEDSHLSNLVLNATGHKMDPSKIKLRLEGVHNGTDQQYIDLIAKSIIDGKIHDRPVPNPNSFTPDILIRDYNKMKNNKENTNKIPKILQLGAPSITKEVPLCYSDSISKLRTCNRSGGYLDYILSSLSSVHVQDDHLVTLSISQSQVEQEQLQGPGRKSYLKKNGLSIPRKAPTHIGLHESHISLINDFIISIDENISGSAVTELDMQGFTETGLNSSMLLNDIMSEFHSSSVTTLTKFYQNLSNEIVLNSMRRRKSRQYALGYTGFRGIYFIIAPGPQLRTESNVEFVKIISMSPGLSHQLSAPWHSIGDHWESDWLSVDTDRLCHWQRSHDRILMGTLANCERLTRPGMSFKSSIKEEISIGNYALFALTYLEDKQLTSTTNQFIRYMWMKSIGDKKFKGIISKFPQRINSVIQSLMVQRSINSCISLCKTDLSDLVKLDRIVRDDDTGLYDETTTGMTNLMPRLFTFGSHVPISYNLNEIYWCMAYNKDRQNPAQDSLNILTKILKEESKYDEELSRRSSGQSKVNYLLGVTTASQDIEHIHSEKPESHFFSSRAVSIGIRLQDTHSENFGDRGSWLNSIKIENILSKNLSQFATFKASVKEITRHLDPQDHAEISKLGQRTKAIELISEIVSNEKLMTSAEIAMTYSGSENMRFEIFIQIFKKNQIGGVREIIILFIKARVMFNILEEVARLLSKSDKREILTKGRDKRLMMRGDYEELMSSYPKGTPLKIVKDSFDMTSWAQKFIPTIFINLFEHHFKSFPGLRDFSRFMFLSHSNKVMEFPKKLVDQWYRHPEVNHDEPAVQKYKDEFLSSGKSCFTNHSNMCQGITHYNSTVLALSCLSLRDSLFKSALKQLGKECNIKWRSRVGSDDKGNVISIDMSKKDSYYQYILFGQCERASERLHSMELSVKSASGHIMYELNSAFMSNLETLSPTIKFAIASVDVIGTTSCTNFVNESYGRIRQLRENGSSSIVCSVAHSLNSRHFYNIFATGIGQENDIQSIFKTKFTDIPYDFGVYPTYDIDIQDLVGPEYYNYEILRRLGSTTATRLLYSEITPKTMEEMFPSDNTPLLKKDHFGINQGLVKQLSNMRRRVGADPEKINQYFQDNPFIMIRGPETITETLMTINAKLYTKGASESLRRTSPAIYIGRLSAFRTSKSWTSPYQNQECFDSEKGEITHRETYTKATYLEFLTKGVEICQSSKSGFDIESMINILYPQHNSFDIVKQFIGKFGATKSTSKKYSQAVRVWTVNNFNYEYTSNLKSILLTSFGSSHEATTEDVNEFKTNIGMKLESLPQVIEDCKSRGIRPLDLFFYMSKVHKNSTLSRVQAFGHGPSTRSLHMTILSMKRYNHSPGMTMLIEDGIEHEEMSLENTMHRKLDRVKLLYNLIIMRDTDLLSNIGNKGFNVNISGIDLVENCLTIIRSIKSVSGFDNITQKTLKLVACELLDKNELKEKLVSWKSLNFTYIRKQRKVTTQTGRIQWSGDLEVLVSSESECYTIVERQGYRYIRSKKVTDLGSLYRSLRDMCKTLDMDLQSFFKMKFCKIGDVYLSDSSKQLHTSQIVNNLRVLTLIIDDDFPFRKISDLDDFTVTRQLDRKTHIFQVFLRDRIGRTATICHSNGNYYPIEIEPKTSCDTNIKYMGVTLNELFKNKSWFFNYRLPSMAPNERLLFLKNHVNMSTIADLKDKDIKKIQEYIEVREEVNEESFSIIQNTNSYDGSIIENLDAYKDMDFDTIEDMFRETMNSTVLPANLMESMDNIDNWADEVNDSFDGKRLDFESSLENDDGIKLVRAFGYKKPQANKSMNTISSLQQGHVLKSRILNCFFQDQSIDSERVRQLPNMFLYLLRLDNRQLSQSIVKLKDDLMSMILNKLAAQSNKQVSDIRSILINSYGSYVVPLSMFHSYITNQPTNDVDIIEAIFRESDEDNYNEEFPKIEDSDSDEYSDTDI